MKIELNDTYLKTHGNVDRVFVVDIDGDLALIYILWVIVDDYSFYLPVLATEGLGAKDFIRGVSSRDADHVEELLLDNPERHQLFDLDLILERLSGKGHGIALAVAKASHKGRVTLAQFSIITFATSWSIFFAIFANLEKRS